MKNITTNLFDLIKVAEINTGDEVVLQVQDVLTVAEILEELHGTDIMYKLSYIGGDMLHKLATKCTSIKLLEIPEEEIDTYFSDEEKAYIFGCYLMATIPESLSYPDNQLTQGLTAKEK